jgi:hypothetical protein
MDANTLAKSIVDQAIGEKPIKKPKPKSAAAVARGKERFAAMSKKQVSENARNAANKRWTAAESSIKMNTGE